MNRKDVSRLHHRAARYASQMQNSSRIAIPQEVEYLLDVELHANHLEKQADYARRHARFSDEQNEHY